MGELREWYGYTTWSCLILLFNSSMIHGLDSRVINYRTEHQIYIDDFFKHRWFHGNHKRDELSLVQAWNSFIGNIENVGRQAWLDKLVVARNRFEHNSITGARYKLNRLPREAGLPCLERQVYLASRGDRSV